MNTILRFLKFEWLRFTSKLSKSIRNAENKIEELKANQRILHKEGMKTDSTINQITKMIEESESLSRRYLDDSIQAKRAGNRDSGIMYMKSKLQNDVVIKQMKDSLKSSEELLESIKSKIQSNGHLINKATAQLQQIKTIKKLNDISENSTIMGTQEDINIDELLNTLRESEETRAEEQKSLKKYKELDPSNKATTTNIIDNLEAEKLFDKLD